MIERRHLRNMCRVLALVFCALFVLSSVACAASTDFAALTWNGSVVGVLDGDTLEVLHTRHAERIRLYGIDCPEKRQAFGKVAKLATSSLVFGQAVTVKPHDTDRYRRVVAEVFLPDGTNLNHQLVKDGWCWWYRKYAPEDTVLEALEREAREAKRGLWVDPQPVPPWEWRKRK
ncbi:MAG: thermonuclease family protein [Nitrospira sp.]|nr:thermonuclease family protein [Nitrospira sp.]